MERAAARVAVYTHDLAHLRRRTAGQTIHEAGAIDVWRIDVASLDELAARLDRRSRLDATCAEGALYVTVGGTTLERLTRASLGAP